MALSTASAIKDALITNLSAASVFGPGQVSTAYDVMETTSACCFVLTGFTYENGAMTFGNTRQATWNLQGKGFVKDTGNAQAILNNAIALIDKVILTLQSDDTLQGTVEAIGAVTGTYDSEVQVEAAGATWLPINMGFELVDYE